MSMQAMRISLAASPNVSSCSGPRPLGAARPGRRDAAAAAASGGRGGQRLRLGLFGLRLVSGRGPGASVENHSRGSWPSIRISLQM